MSSYLRYSWLKQTFRSWLQPGCPLRTRNNRPNRLKLLCLEDRITPSGFGPLVLGTIGPVDGYNASSNPTTLDYTLLQSGGNLELVDTSNPATILASQPLSNSSVTIAGADKGDILTVDLSTFNGSDPFPSGGVVFNAGASNLGTLDIIGQAVAIETYNFSGAHGGSVNVGGAVVDTTGLATINDNGSATNRIFTYAVSGSTITVSTAAAGFDTISANTGVLVTFPNPAASLEVDANNGSDSIAVNQFDNAFNAGLTINATGATTSAIVLNTSYTPGNAGNIAVDSGGSVSVTAALDVSADTISLTAGTNITQSAAAVITSSQLTTSSATGTALGTAANVVGSFSAANSTSGPITLLDAAAGGLTVTSINESGGGTVSITNNTGALTVEDSGVQASGAVTIVASGLVTVTHGGIDNSTGSGDVSLTSTGAGVSIDKRGISTAGTAYVSAAGNISVSNSGIDTTAGTGNISVTTTVGTATVNGLQSAGNVIVSAPGLVSVIGGIGINNSAGTGTVGLTSTGDGIVITNGGVTSRGTVTLQANSGVSIESSGINDSSGIGSVSVTSTTGNIDFSAGSGILCTTTVNLTAAAGAIAAANTTADVTAQSLAASAADGITLYTSVANLTAETTSDSIFLMNTARSLTETGISAPGNIDVSTTGGLTINNPVVSSGGTVALTGGAGGTGSAIALNAAVTGSTVTIDGGAGADTISVNTAGVVPLTLDGKGGGDEYIVNFSSGIGPILSQVNIADSGTSGSNQAVIDGTSFADTFNVSEAQTVLVGGQTVAYTSNLQQLTLNGLAGQDVFNVTPSRYAAITINGGSPSFGQAGVPPGDTLNFNPLGNTFSQNINTFYTNGGSPAYQGVSFNDIEQVPIISTGTTSSSYQFLGNTTAPVQAGYTSVLPGRIYGSRTPGADFGWVATAPKTFTRTTGATSAFADFLSGGAWGTSGAAGSATFKADVANGWYLVSVKMGEIIAHNGMQIVNAYTGQVLLNNLNSPSDQLLEQTFEVYVTNGTMALTFSSTSPIVDPNWVLNALDIRPAVLLSEGFAPQGPLTADGVTVDTFTIYHVTPNAELTVKTTLGTIVSADTDPNVAGIQVRANAAGTAQMELQRPSGGGLAWVTFEEVTGDQTGMGLVTYGLSNSRMFDFIAPNSPTQQPTSPPTVGGYFGVQAAATYTPATGFGWIAPVKSFDRGPVSGTSYSNLLRDGAYGVNPGTFRADLPNGTYEVTVTQGDANYPRTQMNVAVVVGSGTGLSNVSTAAGQFAVNSFIVTVTNGRMELQFSTTGSSWVVNGLDFRLLSSVVPLKVSGPTASLTADDETLDTFNVTGATPGVLYTVSTTLGSIGGADADSSFAGTQIVAPSSSFSFQVQRPITAGTATVSVADVTGASSGTASATYVWPTTRLFEFGTGTSKIGTGSTPAIGPSTASNPGYLNVTGSTLYSAASGSGWTSPVGNFSRPGTSISSTGAYGSAKSPGTFDIQLNTSAVPSYTVAVTVGDASFAWNNIQVTVKGATIPVQTVSVAAGQSKVLTFDIPVSAIPAGPVAGTGLLSITFGGGSPYWVVNAISVTSP